ncbi:serine hydrolase [Streptomyces sp. NPDC059832]|uniref:serine hydrolase n=1 Tax=Streptomyces sp. NPDC059832 TaxID=3346966 RepID=UPI00364C2ABD
MRDTARCRGRSASTLLSSYGRPSAENLRRNVFGPAGMHHTFLPRGAEFPPPHAQGYTDRTASGRTENATDWNRSWAWAAGGAISDRRDLRTRARVPATGTLLSPATRADRIRFQAVSSSIRDVARPMRSTSCGLIVGLAARRRAASAR